MHSDSRKFKVKLSGRTGLVYTEGKKKITIDSELLFDPPGVTVYTDSIKSWDAPFDNETLSGHELERIIRNIKEDLEKHGYSVDLA